MEDLIFENHWRYLDVAFLDVIWKQWKLSKIFSQSDGKNVQTLEIVEILTLYRCLYPGSYFSAVDWFNKTALDRILHTNGQHINKSRIFRKFLKLMSIQFRPKAILELFSHTMAVLILGWETWVAQVNIYRYI